MIFIISLFCFVIVYIVRHYLYWINSVSLSVCLSAADSNKATS